MKIYAIAVTAAILLLALAQPVAQAQDNYYVPSVVYTDDDVDRAVDDEVTGGQVAIGRHLTDSFALEGVAGWSSLSGIDDINILELGVNGIWSLNRERRLSPYVLVGLGLLDTESDLLGDEKSGMLTYGVGLNLRLGKGPVALRLEHRARDVSENSSSISDRITSLGLSFAFGEKDMPPTPPPMPEDPDSDGDGVKDSMDRCPGTRAGLKVDARGCPLDGDGDGVIDEDDQCPNTFRGATVDARGCEMDDDKDGVVNRLDKCPNSAAGVQVDVNGCEIRDVIDLPGVNFETNSDRLLPGADRVLQDAAATLRKYPQLVVEVAGHTDSQGEAAYNQGLSERRAKTVRDYLINAGASAANLSIKGYGEAMPVADNTTAVGRAQNRRVELRIIGR